MLFLLVFAAVAIGMSLLCSIWEAVVLSITPSYVATMEEKSPKLYKHLVKYKENIDTPLAAILTINTISHTVGAAGVGAMVTDLYGSEYLGIASVIMTLAILLLSEILPKSIAATYWRALTPFTVWTLNVVIFVLKPFLYFSNILMRMFSGKEDVSSIREEIKALAKLGKDKKVLDDSKYRVISNIMNLHEVKVKDVMTPRTVVHSVNPNMTIKEFDDFLTTSPFSRLPIIDEMKGKYLGYIHKSSSYGAKDSDLVSKYAHEMKSFYTEAPLEKVLTSMLNERYHIALVIDHHETWVGIITLEDIIETILGKEIVDETDEVADMQLYAKMKWANKEKLEK